MRILLVNYRYFISGGPERYMFNIKRVLEENGHEVIPFSIHSNKNIETPYSKNFVEPIGSRDAVYFDECKKTPKVICQMLSRSIYSFGVKRAIQREIDDVKPDVVYIIHFINKLSPSVIRGAKQRGVPVVQRLSDYFMLCPRFDFLRDRRVCEDCLTKGLGECVKHRCVKGSLFASLVRVFSMKVHQWIHVYDDVDAFITPSRFLRQKLIDNGYPAEKIHCVPTFTADTSGIAAKTGDYGLYLGRISEEKGVDTLVRAYEGLPDHKLLIAGDDTTDEAKRLKAYIEEHGIRNIEFTGFKSGDALKELVAGCRFTVIPSIWYENLPNSALESYRYGKPILASNIGSMPEAVPDGETGLLFTPGSADDLREKILRMDDDARLARMSARSAQWLAERFSEEKHYETLMEIMQSVRR